VQDIPGWLKHTTVWLLLGVGLFLGVSAWQQQQVASRFTVQGQAITIQRSGDGHYHWPGRIGAGGSIGSGGVMREIEFLVDTGATGTAIPAALARELGLTVVGTMQSNTAGGVVQGQVVLADLQLDGGVRAERIRLTALPQLSAPLLGMDVLGKLAWRQEGGVLRVSPAGAGS
jgi:aspartyl protease family protein